uniref:dITP/XTP pyrophosphatase n=1 Tax=Magnetococcus massalia (strain MO-1) TaxID=451514 RepID=A0A1S7LLF2_MAGMO|nr:Nucleoside-triphosphatase [Candidatus Magnetococcus massalia]
MALQQVVLATRNGKKLKELARALEGLEIEVVGLDRFPDAPEVVEDGDSFVANALKKAHAIAAYTQRPALADDSGLEVDALGGAPGVYSARYAGEGASDGDNVTKLLAAMVGQEDKRARFRCELALMLPSGQQALFSGTVEGQISETIQGEGGFGYDPLFIAEGESRTFAQMTPQEKDALSHRGRAVGLFIEALKSAQGQLKAMGGVEK